MSIIPQFSKTYIYGLVDPRTNQIRYIGKSDRPKERLTQHLSKSPKQRTYKSNWINELLKLGLTPVLTILEEVINRDWGKAEQEWIDKGKQRGWPLTNQADGGRGKGVRRGSTNSEETRRKISEKLKGRKVSKEVVEKTAALLRGRKRPAEVVEKISASRRGKKMTGKALDNIREARSKKRGIKHSAELVEKRVAGLRGKKRKSEDMEKMAITRKKLTQQQADRIRDIYKAGKFSQVELAKKFDVSENTIYRIVNNKHKYAYKEE